MTIRNVRVAFKTSFPRRKQRRDPPVTVAAILAGQRDDVSRQRIFVRSLHRQIALRSAPLPQHPARLPLAHPILSARMFHGAPASLGA